MAAPSSQERELFFLIAHYLSKYDACNHVVDMLAQIGFKERFFPTNCDWEGNHMPMDFDHLKMKYSHIDKDFLLQVMARFNQILQQVVPAPVMGIQTLLGEGSFSLLRETDQVNFETSSSVRKKQLSSLKWCLRRCLFAPELKWHLSMSYKIISKEIGQHNFARWTYFPRDIYRRFNKMFTVLGHTDAVYCVLFDRTSKLLVTGGDDYLVKVWSTESGFLLYTLRGHTDVITDMAIDDSNNFLATGAGDSIVRVWSLKSGAQVAVLLGHTGSISSVRFAPITHPDILFLQSSSYDGTCRLWRWDAKSREFAINPVIFSCRLGNRDQVRCSVFSKSGAFFAAAGTDGLIRLFQTSWIDNSLAQEPISIIEAHEGIISTLQFARNDSRILSGSYDGSVKIWRFDRTCFKWSSVCCILKNMIALNSLTSETMILNANGNMPEGISDHSGDNANIPFSNGILGIEREKRHSGLRANMLLWSLDDSRAVIAVSDNTIRIWDIKANCIEHSLFGHRDEVFVLDCHPFDERILLSAGYDGQIFIWDILSGEVLQIFDFSMKKFLDGRFSEDGLYFSVTDYDGACMMFAFDKDSSQYRSVPLEQFFPSDYQSVIRDLAGFVLDDATQLPPHIVPRQPLCDIRGEIYSSCLPSKSDIDSSLQPAEFYEEISIKKRAESVESLELLVDIPPEVRPNLVIKRKKGRRPVFYESDIEENLEQPDNLEIVQEDAASDEYHGSETSEEDESWHEDNSYEDIQSEYESADSQDAQFNDDSDRSYSEQHQGSSDYEFSHTKNQNRRNHSKRRRSSRSNSRSETTSRFQKELKQFKKKSKGSSKKIRLEDNFALTKWDTYLPSLWISSTRQLPSQYYPQVGDKVVYLRQGHEKFLNGLKIAFKSELMTELPWENHPNLEYVLFGSVMDVEFRVGPPQWCILHIELESNSHASNLKILTIKYFDREGISDFIVLRSKYERSKKYSWKEGDLFKTFFDNQLYPGQIVESRDFDATHFPGSSWNRCLVRWLDSSEIFGVQTRHRTKSIRDVVEQNAELDYLSPWELEPFDYTEKEIEEFAESLSIQQIEYISDRLRDISELPSATAFLYDVDFAAYPEYCMIIAYPMCIEKILNRLQGHFYRRLEAFEWDVALLGLNAEKFNEPASEIVKNARVVQSLIIDISRDCLKMDSIEKATLIKRGKQPENSNLRKSELRYTVSDEDVNILSDPDEIQIENIPNSLEKGKNPAKNALSFSSNRKRIRRLQISSDGEESGGEPFILPNEIHSEHNVSSSRGFRRRK